jgi:hypothetical protein
MERQIQKIKNRTLGTHFQIQASDGIHIKFIGESNTLDICYLYHDIAIRSSAQEGDITNKAKAICELLNLDINAGLGWRLSQATIEEDSSRDGTYYLAADNVVETISLAQALNILADKVQARFIARPR